MNQYNSVKIKLSNLQLDKLKLATKNENGVIGLPLMNVIQLINDTINGLEKK